MIKKTSKNIDFYEALKKAQPLAFLASFSLIIGIISSGNNLSSLPDIQSDAIIAGFMFVFAFITAIIHQLSQTESTEKFTRLSQYFFFIIGIIYFLSIALKFSETLLQIPTIFVGWLIIFLGIYFFIKIYPIKNKFWKTKNKIFEIEDKIGYPLVGLAFFIIGGALVASAIFQQSFDWIDIAMWSIGFGLGGFSLIMALEILRMVPLMRKMMKK